MCIVHTVSSEEAGMNPESQIDDYLRSLPA